MTQTSKKIKFHYFGTLTCPTIKEGILYVISNPKEIQPYVINPKSIDLIYDTQRQRSIFEVHLEANERNLEGFIVFRTLDDQTIISPNFTASSKTNEMNLEDTLDINFNVHSFFDLEHKEERGGTRKFLKRKRENAEE